MWKGKILSTDVDVKVNMGDYRVLIFNVDPVGFSLASEDRYSSKEEDLVPSVNLSDLSNIVSWAYNLGYESGHNEATESPKTTGVSV